LGVAPLITEDVGPGWASRTSCGFYILKEAEARSAGNQLGPVGGRIVAEVPSHCWAPMVHRISPRRRPSAGTVLCSSRSAVASAGGPAR
ncbi:MAG TPA: hypothetical protein VJ371_07600, partial [Streptosporangiaceae bacterium]|nr:hypothetical protein [Streptosporangiaceae bacterium]